MATLEEWMEKAGAELQRKKIAARKESETAARELYEETLRTTPGTTQTWRQHLTAYLKAHGKMWADIEQCNLTDEQLDEFWRYGTSDHSLLAWTKTHVYFGCIRDDEAWQGDADESYVDSVPRNPPG